MASLCSVSPSIPHFLRGGFKQTRDLAIESLVVICLSEPEAEKLFFPGADDYGDQIDLLMARNYLQPYLPAITLGYHIDRLRGAAQRLVADARPQIQLIATALLRHGALR